MAHNEQSVFDHHFLNIVRKWFTDHSDIFVFARYSETGGGSEHFWFDNFDEFRAQLDQFPPQTDLIVFRDNQFPLRGVVDDNFISQALHLTADKTELMMVDKVRPPNKDVYIWIYETQTELVERLSEFRGRAVAVGRYPDWSWPDSEAMISGLVPLPNGTLKRGIY